ncbi:hypothetical protein ACFWPK_33680 [Nocardia sp. NPDC058519]|uniref:hypothetical protein n=1 Tax=Nocardia sp. NPDC058519 TaxID=3346535 RepID=UPI0036526105
MSDLFGHLVFLRDTWQDEFYDLSFPRGSERHLQHGFGVDPSTVGVSAIAMRANSGVVQAPSA